MVKPRDFARGKSGIGNYVLRNIYSDESLDVHAIPLINISDPSMIVRSIQERNLIIKTEKKEDVTLPRNHTMLSQRQLTIFALIRWFPVY